MGTIFVREASNYCYLEVLRHTQWVQQVDRTTIIQDFTNGLEYIKMEATVKLSTYSVLPLRSAVFGLIDERKAKRSVVRNLLECDEAMRRTDPRHIHPRSHKLYSPSGARSQVVAWIGGTPLEDAPEVRRWRAMARFALALETSVETRHARLHGDTRNAPNHGGCHASLYQRKNHLESECLQVPDELNKLVSCIEKTRSPKLVATSLGLHSHAVLLPYLEPSGELRQDVPLKYVSQVIYRTDSHTQNLDLPDFDQFEGPPPPGQSPPPPPSLPPGPAPAHGGVPPGSHGCSGLPGSSSWPSGGSGSAGSPPPASHAVVALPPPQASTEEWDPTLEADANALPQVPIAAGDTMDPGDFALAAMGGGQQDIDVAPSCSQIDNVLERHAFEYFKHIAKVGDHWFSINTQPRGGDDATCVFANFKDDLVPKNLGMTASLQDELLAACKDHEREFVEDVIASYQDVDMDFEDDTGGEGAKTSSPQAWPEAPAEANVERCVHTFFRAHRGNPKDLKRPAVDLRLSRTDGIAVSTNAIKHIDRENQLVKLSTQPEGGTESLKLLVANPRLSSMLKWEIDPIGFQLSGQPFCPDVSKAIHHLFKTGLLESQKSLSIADSEESRSVLHGLRKLAECNIVKCVSDDDNVSTWEASEASLELDVSSSVGNPCRALKPRPGVALENQMVHELVLHLENLGWCKEVWSSAGEPPCLKLATVQPKVIYFKNNAKTVLRQYVLALANHDELRKRGRRKSDTFRKWNIIMGYSGSHLQADDLQRLPLRTTQALRMTKFPWPLRMRVAVDVEEAGAGATKLPWPLQTET